MTHAKWHKRPFFPIAYRIFVIVDVMNRETHPIFFFALRANITLSTKFVSDMFFKFVVEFNTVRRKRLSTHPMWVAGSTPFFRKPQFHLIGVTIAQSHVSKTVFINRIRPTFSGSVSHRSSAFFCENLPDRPTVPDHGYRRCLRVRSNFNIEATQFSINSCYTTPKLVCDFCSALFINNILIN